MPKQNFDYHKGLDDLGMHYKFVHTSLFVIEIQLYTDGQKLQKGSYNKHEDRDMMKAFETVNNTHMALSGTAEHFSVPG